MKYVLIAVALATFGFLAGYVLRTSLRPADTVIRTATPSADMADETDLPTYAPLPPAEALAGSIDTVTGTVLIYPRTGDDPQPATEGGRILQDDRLVASPSASVTLRFGGDVSLSMNETSSVTFAQLLPQSFLLWQRSGTVDYAAGGAFPLSVRTLDGLFTLSTGSATVSMAADGSGARVAVASGSATLAQVDAGNETRVVPLTAGESAVLDSVREEIRLLR